MKRLILTVAAIVLTAGCGDGKTGRSFEPSRNPVASSADVPDTTGTPSATDTVEATPRPAAFEDITLVGNGKGVAKFTIPDGEPGIAVMTHTGKGNFIVHSKAANGETNDALVDTIGNYSGTVGFDLGDEEHSVAFQIDSDGTWTITVKPATAAPAWDPATTLKGNGDRVYGVAPPTGDLVLVTFTYKGDDTFIVRAWNSDGPNGLAHERGTFTGKVWLPPDTFLIEVDADSGSWAIAPS
jgi:hypothetical protein